MTRKQHLETISVLGLAVSRIACALILSVALLVACDDRPDATGHSPLGSAEPGQSSAPEPAHSGGLSTLEAYVRQPAPGQVVLAAFVIFRNDSDRAYTLVDVSSPRARFVEVHRTTHDDGVMAMRPVEQLVMAPRSEVVFEPGGYHLMMSELVGSFHPGDQIPLRFSFKEGVSLDVSAEVRPIN